MNEQQQFIERAGVTLEMQGMSRAAGRVLAAILTAPPGGYNAAEMAELLQSSRAGISVALKQLLMVGLIEHAPVPGERADRYRIRSGGWAVLNETGIRKLEVMRSLARDGLAALPDNADPRPLAEMEETMEIWLSVFPEFLEKVNRTLRERQAARQHLPPQARQAVSS